MATKRAKQEDQGVEIESKGKMAWEDPREEAFAWISMAFGLDNEHIFLNKSTAEHFLNILLPGKVIVFLKDEQVSWGDATPPDMPCALPHIAIDTETGTLLKNDELEIPTMRSIPLNTLEVPTIDYMTNIMFPEKYLYIYSMRRRNSELETPMVFQFAAYDKPKKKMVSFTIDQWVYDKFVDIADSMAINKSKFVENTFKTFIEKNR